MVRVIRGGGTYLTTDRTKPGYISVRGKEDPGVVACPQWRFGFCAGDEYTPAAQKQAVRSVRRQLFPCRRAGTQERTGECIIRASAGGPGALEDPPLGPHTPSPSRSYMRFRARGNRATTGHNMLYALSLHPFIRC